MLFTRREIPWEVVERKSIDAVPIIFEDLELDLAVVKQFPIKRKYVLEVKELSPDQDLSKAVIFAQKQLLDEIEQNGYNVLLSESWQVTLLRRSKLYRIEVEYCGRPARARNAGSRRQPPYMAVLQDLTHCHLVKKVDSDKVVQKRMKDHLPIRALIRT